MAYALVLSPYTRDHTLHEHRVLRCALRVLTSHVRPGCSIPPDAVSDDTIQQWRDELRIMQVEQAAAGYGRRPGHQPGSSPGKRRNRRGKHAPARSGVSTGGGLGGTLTNSVALLSSEVPSTKTKAGGKKHRDYARAVRPRSLQGGAPKAVHSQGEFALRANASTYRAPPSSATAALKSASDGLRSASPPRRGGSPSMFGDSSSLEWPGARASMSPPRSSPQHFAFHTMNVMVDSPGSPGTKIPYVGAHPRRLIASTSMVNKGRSESPDGRQGSRARHSQEPSVYRGALYKTSAALGSPTGLGPSTSVRPNTVAAVASRRGFGSPHGAGMPRSNSAVPGGRRGRGPASSAHLRSTAPPMAAPSPNAGKVRLGQTFALVDRLGAPQRMPDMLRTFWEHNPDLLPDWADDSFRPVTSNTAKRRLASLEAPSHVDFNMSTRGVEKIKRVQWGAAAHDSFEAGSITNIGVSVEMEGALVQYMRNQLGTGLWDDEVASVLAAPLSAVHLTQSRKLHTAGVDSAKRFRGLDANMELLGPRSVLLGTGNPDKFPYGQDAHAAASRVQRGCVLRYWHAWVTRLPRTPYSQHTRHTVCLHRYRRHFRRRVAAATKVEAAYRGSLTRRPYRVMRLVSLAAIVKIQGLLRGRLGRKRWMRFYHAFVWRCVHSAAHTRCCQSSVAGVTLSHRHIATVAVTGMSLCSKRAGDRARRGVSRNGTASPATTGWPLSSSASCVGLWAGGWLGRSSGST